MAGEQAMSEDFSSLTLDELRYRLHEANDEIARLEKRVDTNLEAANRARRRAYVAREQLHDVLWTGQKLSECIIIRRPLPKALVQARRELVRTFNRLESKDITIKQKELLVEKVEREGDKLRELCDHRFVLTIRDAYHGSRSYDYDDRQRGARECMVCGVIEESKSCEKDIYEVLSDDPGVRLAKRDLRRCGSTRHDVWFEFFQLQTIRNLFLASLGNMNISDEAWEQYVYSPKQKEKTAA